MTNQRSTSILPPTDKASGHRAYTSPVADQTARSASNYEQLALSESQTPYLASGFKKNRVFKKKPNPVVFLVLLGFGVLLVFLDRQEKIGKIIQKFSNLKP